ncbi:MAG TPA: hypothetical protein VFI38_08525 [Candidatus Acidoferrum sp.]|nr:hypothetical protein [Candidatus Acidoferrum sp.]
MKKRAYVVKVPRPDPGSYNPDRRMTGLVQNQIFHFKLAERELPEEHRSGVDHYSIDTEAKAAEYIGHLTRKLHLAGASKQAGGKKSELGKKKRA